MRRILLILLLLTCCVSMLVVPIFAAQNQTIINPTVADYSGLAPFYSPAQPLKSHVKMLVRIPQVGWNFTYTRLSSTRAEHDIAYNSAKGNVLFFNDYVYHPFFINPTDISSKTPSDITVKVSYPSGIYDGLALLLSGALFSALKSEFTFKTYFPGDILFEFDYPNIFHIDNLTSFFCLDLPFLPPTFLFGGYEYTLSFVLQDSFDFEIEAFYPIQYISDYVSAGIYLAPTLVHGSLLSGNDHPFKWNSFYNALSFSSGEETSLVRSIDMYSAAAEFSALAYTSPQVNRRTYPVSFKNFGKFIKGRKSGVIIPSSGFGFRFGLYNLNSYSANGVVAPPGGIANNVNTRSCDWYDIPCHLGNAIVYLLYDFPLTSGIVTLVNTIFGTVETTMTFVGLFSGLGVLFTVFMVFFILRLARWLTG